VEGTPHLRVATPSSTAYQRRRWALAVLCLSLAVLAMDNTAARSLPRRLAGKDRALWANARGMASCVRRPTLAGAVTAARKGA
jgi:hypothetical protein